MKDAPEYIARVKAFIIGLSCVTHLSIVREEAQGDKGLFRYRLSLLDGSLVEMFEFFQVENEAVQVVSYSYHWQTAAGSLRKRWDNAAHHTEISRHPFHVHEAEDTNVKPSEPLTAEVVLAMIAAELEQ